MSLSSIIHLPLFPYAYALAVFFLGAFFVCCATAFCAFSCAFRYVGAFSHGLDLCTISFRLDVVSLAANGCIRAMPYVTCSSPRRDAMRLSMPALTAVC